MDSDLTNPNFTPHILKSTSTVNFAGRCHWLLTLVLVLLLGAVSPSLAAGSATDKSYRLREMDHISVQVFGEPGLSKSPRIDGSGQIRMGLIGTIRIAGLTIADVENTLERLYRDDRYLRDPQISIEVLQYAPLYVHVFGQVNRPGRVQLEGEQHSIPILDLISAAGGFNGLAKSDAVRITRTDNNGQEVVVMINVESLIKGRAANAPEGFEELLPGDVVYVPERLF